MSKKHKKRLKEMTEEIKPDELMPYPDRFEPVPPSDAIAGTVAEVACLPEEPTEAPVQPLEPKIEASEAKDVSTEPEVVETGFVSTKVNLYRRR